MAEYGPIVIKGGIPTLLGSDPAHANLTARATLTTTGLAAGDVVQVLTNLTATKAVNTSTSPIVGVYDGESGSIVRRGVVVATFVDTPTAGATAYLSSTAGQLTITKPTKDNLHEVGVVIDASTRKILLQQKPVVALPPSPPLSLWITGYGDKTRQYLSPAWTYQGEVSSETWGRAILWDGNYIWTANNDNPCKIRKYDPITRAIIGTYYSFGNLAGFTAPHCGMAFDGTNYWVACNNSTIQKFSVDGANLGTVGGLGLTQWVVYDGAGSLWVPNKWGSTIKKVDVNSNTVTGTVTLAVGGGGIGCNPVVCGAYAYIASYHSPSPWPGYVARWPIASVGAITPDWEVAMGCNYPTYVSGTDGTYLWTCVNGSSWINRNRLSDGGGGVAYNLSGGQNVGICYDSGFLWVSQDAYSNVKKVNPADGSYVNCGTVYTAVDICTTFRPLPYP
jgi:hypothetical protein